MCALLRQQAGPAVAAAGPLLPDAPGRLLRGDRQRARPGVALCRQPVAARVPAAGHDRAGAGPFLAEQDALAAAAGGARRRSSSGCCSAWPSTVWSRATGSASTPRRWRPMRRCAHRPPRQRRRLPGDAAASGQGKRHRDADGRGSDPAGSPAQRQAAVERRLDLADGPGGQDRQDEGWPHAPRLQARARGRSGYRGHRRG